MMYEKRMYDGGKGPKMNGRRFVRECQTGDGAEPGAVNWRERQPEEDA